VLFLIEFSQLPARDIFLSLAYALDLTSPK